jgi:hypothetical protein
MAFCYFQVCWLGFLCGAVGFRDGGADFGDAARLSICSNPS